MGAWRSAGGAERGQGRAQRGRAGGGSGRGRAGAAGPARLARGEGSAARPALPAVRCCRAPAWAAPVPPAVRLVCFWNAGVKAHVGLRLIWAGGRFIHTFVLQARWWICQLQMKGTFSGCKALSNFFNLQDFFCLFVCFLCKALNCSTKSLLKFEYVSLLNLHSLTHGKKYYCSLSKLL